MLALAAGCESFASSPEADSDAREESPVTLETGGPDADGAANPEAATLTTIYVRGFGSVNDAGEAGAAMTPAGMVVDPGGGVAIVGSYGFGAVDLGGGASLPVPSGADAFLLRLDGNGAHVVSKAFTANADPYGASVAGSSETLCLGTNDIFVAWLDGLGNIVYARRFGDGADDDATAIGLNSAGNVVVAGLFKKSIDFGAGVLAARGATDMFVAKFAR